jgi:hypothetical protein
LIAPTNTFFQLLVRFFLNYFDFLPYVLLLLLLRPNGLFKHPLMTVPFGLLLDSLLQLLPPTLQHVLAVIYLLVEATGNERLTH